MMNIFDYPADFETSKLVYLPIPWDATTSYGQGTALGPESILKASAQIDLFDLEIESPCKAGLYYLEEDQNIKGWNTNALAAAKESREHHSPQKLIDTVNNYSDQLNQFTYNQTQELLKKQKIVAFIGGEHSIPYGGIKALANHHKNFGILHFDAHHDLRVAYEGFTHSHASIMYNVMSDIPEVSQLTQVGIRDFCEEEFEFAKNNSKIKTFYDIDVQNQVLNNIPFLNIAKEIVSSLPNEVYISFDIDGLDPKLCPHTGTPVPGGLNFYQANLILKELVLSGKKIVGFDLVEVSPDTSNLSDEWDANVGMRLLYKLSGWTLASQGICKTR